MYRTKSSFKNKRTLIRLSLSQKLQEDPTKWPQRLQHQQQQSCNLHGEEPWGGRIGEKMSTHIIYHTTKGSSDFTDQISSSSAATSSISSSICTPSSSVHESEELQRLSTLASIAITTRGGAGTSKRFRLVPRRKRAAGDGRRGGQLRRGWPPRQVGCGGRGRARRSPTAYCASRTEAPTPAAA